jgi:hypothetical protein
MRLSKMIVPLAMAGALIPAAAQASTRVSAHSLAHSRELWATVDVCNAKDKPHTIGIRGSMPSDGLPKDAMYMRLRVQFLDPTTKVWTSLSKGGDSGFLKLGAGLLARQGGLSVQLAPGAGTSSFTLRGYAIFQWRRGATVLQSVTRATTAGHTSAAGADPRGFSAATCKLS